MSSSEVHEETSPLAKKNVYAHTILQNEFTDTNAIEMK